MSFNVISYLVEKWFYDVVNIKYHIKTALFLATAFILIRSSKLKAVVFVLILSSFKFDPLTNKLQYQTDRHITI